MQQIFPNMCENAAAWQTHFLNATAASRNIAMRPLSLMQWARSCDRYQENSGPELQTYAPTGARLSAKNGRGYANLWHSVDQNPDRH